MNSTAKNELEETTQNEKNALLGLTSSHRTVTNQSINQSMPRQDEHNVCALPTLIALFICALRKTADYFRRVPILLPFLLCSTRTAPHVWILSLSYCYLLITVIYYVLLQWFTRCYDHPHCQWSPCDCPDIPWRTGGNQTVFLPLPNSLHNSALPGIVTRSLFTTEHALQIRPRKVLTS